MRIPHISTIAFPRLVLLPDVYDRDGEPCLALFIPAPRSTRLLVFRSRPAALAALRAAEAAR